MTGTLVVTIQSTLGRCAVPPVAVGAVHRYRVVDGQPCRPTALDVARPRPQRPAPAADRRHRRGRPARAASCLRLAGSCRPGARRAPCSCTSAGWPGSRPCAEAGSGTSSSPSCPWDRTADPRRTGRRRDRWSVAAAPAPLRAHCAPKLGASGPFGPQYQNGQPTSVACGSFEPKLAMPPRSRAGRTGVVLSD